MDRISDSPKVSKDEIFRKRILESAKALFISHGVENVNMYHIAKASQIGQGSLYRRFTEKGQICTEIVSEECQPFLDELQTYLDQTSDNLPLERINLVIVKFVRFLDANTPWLSDINRASTGYRPLQSPLFKGMRNIFTNLYNDALLKKEITDVDVSYTVQALLSTLQDFDNHKYNHEFDTDRILLGIKRIFIEGLKKRSSC